MKKWLVAALLAFPAIPSLAASPPDVVGIQIGMSMDQARSHLSPKFKVTDFGGISDPDQKVIIAAADDEFITIGTISDKVYWIYRSQAYPRDGEPNAESLKQQLIEKYGPLSDRTGTYLPPPQLWIYDTANAPMFLQGNDGNPKLNECMNSLNSVVEISNQPDLRGRTPGLPRMISQYCPMAIGVIAIAPPEMANPALVRQLSVTVLDQASLVAWQKRKADEAARSARDAADRARSVKPPL